jgi:hypothetical protein
MGTAQFPNSPMQPTAADRAEEQHAAKSLTPSEEEDEEEMYVESSSQSATVVKCILAGILFTSAIMAYMHPSTMSLGASIVGGSTTAALSSPSDLHGRRLSAMGDTIPSYVEPLMADLKGRKKLFEETPPEEIKYWFEYTGPLQVSSSSGVHQHCNLPTACLFVCSHPERE